MATVHKRNRDPGFENPDELIGYIRGLLETWGGVTIHGLRESMVSNRDGIRTVQHGAHFELTLTSVEGLEVAPNGSQISTWRSDAAHWKKGAARYLTPGDIQRIEVH